VISTIVRAWTSQFTTLTYRPSSLQIPAKNSAPFSFGSKRPILHLPKPRFPSVGDEPCGETGTTHYPFWLRRTVLQFGQRTSRLSNIHRREFRRWLNALFHLSFDDLHLLLPITHSLRSQFSSPPTHLSLVLSQHRRVKLARHVVETGVCALQGRGARRNSSRNSILNRYVLSCMLQRTLSDTNQTTSLFEQRRVIMKIKNNISISSQSRPLTPRTLSTFP